MAEGVSDKEICSEGTTGGLTEEGAGHHPPTDSDQEAGGDVKELSAATRAAESERYSI